MHIGVVSDTRYITDPRIRNEVRYLSNQGYKISVLNIKYEGSGNSEELEGIRVYNVRVSKRWQKTFRGLQNLLPTYERLWGEKIREFIDLVNPDVIHVHDLYMARAAKMGVRNSHLPIVLDLHENYPAAIQSYSWANQFPKKVLVQPQKWIKKEAEYLGYADKLIVLSEHYKQILTDRYEFIKTENIFVYPNVPDIHQLMSYPIQKYTVGNEGDMVLFYFGAIAHRRGLHTVMEALKILIPQGYKFHLLLIGPIDQADDDMFQKYFDDPVIKEHITYYPWKDISEFPGYVKASDLGISPLIKNDQHESGIANKVYQYMLFESPVLVSDCRPQQNLIEENQCGWVFESENVEDLMRALKLISNSDQLPEMGKNGKRAIETTENLEKKGKALKDLYLNISNNQ